MTVLASRPARLEVDIRDSDMIATAGETLTVWFWIKDAFGNPASTTGTLTIRSTDTNPSASPTPVNQNLAAATSLYARNWILASAGVQFITASLTHPLGTIGETFSDPFLVTADTPDSITGDIPTDGTSELPTAFTIRVRDVYGNPTPLFTEGIRATSPGMGFAQEQYYYSSDDKGEHTFLLRWDLGTDEPINTTVSFGHLRITTPPANALATLTRNIRIDNPRDADGAPPTLPFMNLLLSMPDPPPIASVPFLMTLWSLSIRETPATLSTWIDFSANNGDVLVSTDGVNYGRSIFLNNAATANITAVVTRSGYITVTAKSRNEPTKGGTITFVSRPNGLDTLTLTANSPQKARTRFPFKAEWWDVCRNYAELAQTSLTFNASAIGSFVYDPSTVETGGRRGVFDPSANTQWVDTTFIASVSATNIDNDLILNRISLFPVYDNDFRKGIYNTPWRSWQELAMVGDGYNEGGATFDGFLYLYHRGSGRIAPNDLDTRFNINDGYHFLYFNWPAWDTYSFNADIFIRRLEYPPVQTDTDEHMLGVMARDDVDLANQRHRYICSQLFNTNEPDNMGCRAQVSYRNAEDGDTRIRYLTGAAIDSWTSHPKWLRLTRNATALAWEAYMSPDGELWRAMTSSGEAAPTYGWTVTKLGIAASSGLNTRRGGGWVTDFRINRFTATGSFVSTVYDIGTQPTSLGPVAMTATFTGGATLAFDFKASDTVGPFADINNGWTPLALSAPSGNSFTVTLPAGLHRRYMQYRLRLSAPELEAGRGIASVTPIVYDVNIPYTIANPLGVTFDQRGWVNLIASSASPAASYTLPVEIKGGVVATLAITVPASTTAGAPLTVTVRAGDGSAGVFGNVADDATGTWRFTTSDGEPFPGTIPGDYTLVPAVDKGQRTFYNSSVLRSGMYQTITVTDGTRTATSSLILVNPG
ncbi:MAG TPA: hypothetical protein PKO06_12830, partial [Candidatus Ozemobacteraceae bacterium]|nr:hypothetical protein [Candidatus Ozemobacteraceae bacterium]